MRSSNFPSSATNWAILKARGSVGTGVGVGSVVDTKRSPNLRTSSLITGFRRALPLPCRTTDF